MFETYACYKAALPPIEEKNSELSLELRTTSRPHRPVSSRILAPGAAARQIQCASTIVKKKLSQAGDSALQENSPKKMLQLVCV
ncbi:hypothetical protein AVEN_25504-1 [Araneus ventricosus]|uniref:Uncharacterized protein n=1 Tax=Araneus ventricosus TaxID=182803 RepID=A0A4Y2CS12_ARAVE|nr:hypothetical protein AVEN_25504-1 [Araneus ventricosus]